MNHAFVSVVLFLGFVQTAHAVDAPRISGFHADCPSDNASETKTAITIFHSTLEFANLDNLTLTDTKPNTLYPATRGQMVFDPGFFDADYSGHTYSEVAMIIIPPKAIVGYSGTESQLKDGSTFSPTSSNDPLYYTGGVEFEINDAVAGKHQQITAIHPDVYVYPTSTQIRVIYEKGNDSKYMTAQFNLNLKDFLAAARDGTLVNSKPQLLLWSSVPPATKADYQSRSATCHNVCVSSVSGGGGSCKWANVITQDF